MPRFQFSLAWLMAALTAAGIALFLAIKLTDLIDLVVASLMLCILPTPLVAAAIYGRGDLQAFAIGALLPWLTTIIARYPLIRPSSLTMLIWLLANCAICGVLTMATRRWLLSASRD